MKKTLLVGITIGIAILFTMPINNVSSSIDIEDDEVVNSPIITNSYYTNISGKKYWVSFKITFFEPTNITLEYNRYILQDHMTRIYFASIHHSENSFGFSRRISNFISTDTKYYYQINLGNINKSFYYTKQKPGEYEKREHTQRGPYSDRMGTHYYTFFSYCDCLEKTFEIWINTSHNVSISKTQGTEVFVFEREDFFGNINVGCKRGTMILKGVKKIHINNTLFAYFDTDPISTGFNFLKYISPSGHHKQIRQIRKLGFPPLLFGHKKESEFEKGLWWAENGTWTFKTTIVKMSLRKSYPMTFLFGADIKLPE